MTEISSVESGSPTPPPKASATGLLTVAGLAAAKRRGRSGGRPPALVEEQIKQIVATLDAGASKASVCRSFKVPRSTLLDTLKRIGWLQKSVG